MNTKRHAFVRHIIEQLPPEQRYTFSDQQVDALHQSALALPKAKHIINIRVSVPFIGKGFYMVLLAGREQRSQRRLMADNEFKVLPNLATLLTIILGCTTLFGLAYAQRILSIYQQNQAARLNEVSNVVHPTIVPFKYDREQCEASNREWKDGQCYDYDHSHKF